MLAAQGRNALHHFRYRLDVDVEPVDARMLRDALEDEPFGLRQRYGMPEISRQLDDYALKVHTSTTERWTDFASDLEILSVYLSQYIIGYEIELQPTQGAPIIEARKIVACRGEVVTLEVHARWNHRSARVDIEGERLDQIRERWASFPEWLRNALRLKHPDLRAL